jgi:hypothetical protein
MRITLTFPAFLGLLLSACTKDPTIQPIQPVAIQKEVEYQVFAARDYNEMWWLKDTKVTLRLLIGKISLNDGTGTELFDSTFNTFTLGQFSSLPNQISIKKSFPIIEEKEKMTVRYSLIKGDPLRTSAAYFEDLEKGVTWTLVRIEL